MYIRVIQQINREKIDRDSLDMFKVGGKLDSTNLCTRQYKCMLKERQKK